MSSETIRLIHDLIRPGIDLSEAQVAFMAYTEHLQQNPEAAAEVLALTGLPVYDVPLLNPDEEARQADQLLRDREQLDRDIADSGYYPPKPFGIDFKKAAQEPRAPREVTPTTSAFYDDALTPAQADLLQKGRDMRLPFGKFGPKGVKGYKTIHEIWLEEPTYLDWVFENVDRLTPLQELVIGFYRYYKGNGRKPQVAAGYVPFPGTT